MQPIMSDYSSRSRETYEDPFRSISIIQMSDAQRDIDNPNLLKIKLLWSLEMEGDLDEVIAILEEVMEESDPNSQEIVTQYICEAFIAFPIHYQKTLLENHPLFFVQLIKYWKIEQRMLVLEHLIGQLENWKELLVGVFENLDFKEEGTKAEDKLPRRFLAYLLESFSSRRKRQWIKHCSREMNYSFWAFLVIILQSKDRKLALQTVNKTLNYDLSENGFLFCFEAFAVHLDQHPIEVKTILGNLLHRFYQAKKFDVIVDQFKKLNTTTQVCLLNAMTPSKQSQVLYRYRKDAYMMSQLFDQLFLMKKEFHEQRRVVERFGKALTGGNLSEFVQCLLINDSKVGTYLLVCLPDETFQSFIYDVEVGLRTEILLKSECNSTAEEILSFVSKEREKFIYALMGLDSKDISIQSYTVKSFFDSLQGAVDDMLVNCTSSLIDIPPFIIGLVTKMGNHSELLIKLAPFMNDEQLKFFISALSVVQFYSFVEEHSLSLGFSKQETLLKGLSTEKLILYVQRKMNGLKEAQKKFYEDYNQLQSALSDIEEGEVLHSKEVEKLEDQAVKLYILARMPLQSNYHYLSRFLKDLNQKNTSSDFHSIFDELQQSMDQLKSKCHFFQRPHGIIVNQLDELKSSMIVDEEEEETIDLTRTLYDGFWTVVRDGTLPYLGISSHSQLGITDVNQLSCLGILSDEDLEHLGISSVWQKHVTTIILELEKLQVIKPKTDSNEDEPTVSALWNECTQIKLSKEEAHSKSQQIVNILSRSSIASSNFKQGVVRFCNALLKFPHLSSVDSSMIRKKCANLKKTKGGKMISTRNSLLASALILLRAQHPLFCLQRYLVDNVNLKQTWEKLRSNGYNSIHDLFEKQLISHPEDLLRLEEMANKAS